MINIAPRIVNCDSIFILATLNPALKITTIQKATNVPKIFPLPPKMYVPPSITIKTISSSAPVAILNLATANLDVVKIPAIPQTKPDKVNSNSLILLTLIPFYFPFFPHFSLFFIDFKLLNNSSSLAFVIIP